MKLCKFLFITAYFLIFASWLSVTDVFAQDNEIIPAEAESEVEKAVSPIIGAQESAAPDNSYNIETPKILSLNECIDIAVKNHLPLKIAKKNVKLAEWRVWEARRNMLPKVSVKWDEYTGIIYGRHYYGKKQSVDINHTLYHGGEFFFTMKQAETNLKVVNREFARIKNDLTLQVKKGYYTLAKAKENMKIQTGLSHEVLRIHEMVVKQFESGVTANLEFLNVNSQVNQIKFQMTSARGDVEVAELILKQAMNVDIKEKIDIDAVLDFEKKEVNFEQALLDAHVHRPEMQISSLMVTYYTYEYKLAKTKSWPKIDFMGSFGLAKEEFISKDAGPDPITGASSGADQKLEQQWYAGIKCSVPMWGSTTEYSFVREQWVPQVSAVRGTETITNAVKFNFLDNLAQYSDKYSADIDVNRARQEFIKTKQDVTLEVKETCFNYEKALMQLETAKNKVKYQENDLELTKFRRQMDEAQDSNVIESMIRLGQERFGYIQALTDCHIAMAGICKAVGIPDYFENKDQK